MDKRGISDCRRFQNAEYIQKYAAPGVKILDFYQHEYQTVPGEALSATDFRKALATGDESEISKYIPEEASDRIGSILNILGYQVMKEEKKTNMSLLFSLVEEALNEKYVSRKCKKKSGESGHCAVVSHKTKKQKACYDDCDTARAAMHEEELEEMSAMSTGAAAGYAGPVGDRKKKKKKNNNEEIIEYVINYLLGKQRIVEN